MATFRVSVRWNIVKCIYIHTILRRRKHESNNERNNIQSPSSWQQLSSHDTYVPPCRHKHDVIPFEILKKWYIWYTTCAVRMKLVACLTMPILTTEGRFSKCGIATSYISVAMTHCDRRGISHRGWGRQCSPWTPKIRETVFTNVSHRTNCFDWFVLAICAV